MLKTRVMPVVLLTGYNVVKSVNFGVFRTLGNPITVCRIYESRGVDELILLDIRATPEARVPQVDIIRDISGECFMPLTVGGGIKTVEQARLLLRNGADKIAINTSAVESPELITAISKEFGAQCCVISIDVKLEADGRYQVYTHGGKTPAGLDPVAWAKEVEKLGAGEILLNSIDRDGTMTGYDLNLISQVSAAVKLPVVAVGGAGTPNDCVTAIRDGGATAAAAASMFHFTSHTPKIVKEHLYEAGIAVRLEH
jgi:cyclase